MALDAIDTASVRAIPTPRLRDELARALEVTAAHLQRLAAIWRELEHRGEDLSDLRSGLWAYMPLIASGRLRAELVVQYAGHSMLLRRIADLPMADQDRLLRDRTVPLVERGTDGRFRERVVPLTHLKSTQVAQVFGAGKIRAPGEQRRAAIGLARRSASVSREARALAQVASMAVDETEVVPDQRIGLQIPLSSAERDALKTHAARMGVPISRLVRAALRAANLLTKDES
jgi:hypothetical protein